jgi:16S rRNA processing protein RimM
MEFPPPEFPQATSRAEQDDQTTAPGLRQEARTSAVSAERAAASVPDPMPQWALLAILIRPHGRRGEMLANILTDFPERFHERTRLFLVPPGGVAPAARPVDVETFRLMRNRLVLKMRGVDSILEAEALRGYTLAIPREDRVPLRDGSVYISDLVGCTVIDLNRQGAEAGKIVDVDRRSSSTDLLIVRPDRGRPAEGEVMIPFVREYLVRVDLAGRRVEMRLPPGLLDINAPMTEEEKRENRSAPGVSTPDS